MLSFPSDDLPGESVSAGRYGDEQQRGSKNGNSQQPSRQSPAARLAKSRDRNVKPLHGQLIVLALAPALTSPWAAAWVYAWAAVAVAAWRSGGAA